MTSQFRTTLHNRVDAVQQAIAEAQRVGDGDIASLHRTRLDDLLHLAARTDVDTTGWVDPALVPPTDTSTDSSTVDRA